jgi:hypothetical protein
MRRYLYGFLSAVSLVLVLNVSAWGQQIVSDPLLNQTLLSFQENFSLFLQQHPELVSGSTQPVVVMGNKGRIKFDFQQQTQYNISYGNIRFSATTPISANQFNVTLNINAITLTGDSSLNITDKNGKVFNLQCEGNSFTLNMVAFQSQVTVNPSKQVSFNSTQVKLDPKNIMVNISCLRNSGLSSLTEDEKGLTSDSLDATSTSFTQDTWQVMVSDRPSNGILKKVAIALEDAVKKSSSSVTMAMAMTTMNNGMAINATATSTCNGMVLNDVKAVINDLKNISAQANANGFKTATQQFINDLRTVLPTLSPADQALVQKFIMDLNIAIADGKISLLEQSILTLDFYNIVVSTGITSVQLQTLQTDLLAVLNSLTGISTVQLQADLTKLLADLQACSR